MLEAHFHIKGKIAGLAGRKAEAISSHQIASFSQIYQYHQ